MKKKTKRSLMLITFGVVLYVGLMNFTQVTAFLSNIFTMTLPLVLGGVLAFVLSVPMNAFAKLIKILSEKMKISPKQKVIDGISLFLTVISILLVLALVSGLVIPELVTSVKAVAVLIQDKWPEWAAQLKEYNIDTTAITAWVENLDLENIVMNIASNAGVVVDSIVGTAASTISGLITVVFAIVVMFYVLLSKKELARQAKKLLYANLKTEIVEKIIYVATLLRDTYSKFLSGQCIEAVVLGVLMFIAFTLFRLPYAGLIAILTTVCSFIPYIGAFVSCGIGILLTLLTNPVQAVICFIVYQVVQFIENQFIYPRVVGNSVGLSALWTFVAVLMGGKLFGLVGILFFIPLTAVIYTLIREHTNKKIAEKKISIK